MVVYPCHDQSQEPPVAHPYRAGGGWALASLAAGPQSPKLCAMNADGVVCALSPAAAATNDAALIDVAPELKVGMCNRL